MIVNLNYQIEKLKAGYTGSHQLKFRIKTS